MKTNDNTIRYITESVVIAENLEMYQWVIESMSEMEPKWPCNKRLPSKGKRGKTNLLPV